MIKKIRKFSLVELLLVMAISAIMLGIVIPTFHKITKGVSVETAARQLGAQLKAVREYAITNRVYVALIMEDSDGTTLPQKYLGTAYRPCIVTNNSGTWIAGGDGSNNSDWVSGERWEFLPEGTQIESVANISGSVSGITDTKAGITNVTVPSVVVFSPTGKCESLNGVSTASIKISETVGDSDLDKNYIEINIAPYTGRISYGTN